MRRLIFLTMLSASVFPLAAQTDRATLTGVVVDPSRSVVPGAKFSVKAAATGIEYVALTNSAGVYTFSGLIVGRYTASNG
jgi:Carboxypeptidase regulatory-like domain